MLCCANVLYGIRIVMYYMAYKTNKKREKRRYVIVSGRSVYLWLHRRFTDHKLAERLVLLSPRHHHSTPLLEKLHWLPISERIKYKVACMCFSAVSGSGPPYLSELLHVYTPSRTLRSSSDTRMLEIQQYKRKTHGFRTFSCFGPHIWNSLPQDLIYCSSLSSFKAKLKTFLFSQYFHPN